MFWILGTFVVLSLFSTTPESRETAREKLKRWNPVLIALDLIGLYCLYEILFGPRIN